MNETQPPHSPEEIEEICRRLDLLKVSEAPKIMNWARSNLSYQDFVALELQGKARLRATMKSHYFFESEFRKQHWEIQYWRWILFALTWAEVGAVVGIVFCAIKMKWLWVLGLLIGLFSLIKGIDVSVGQEVIEWVRTNESIFNFCVSQEMVIVEIQSCENIISPTKD